MDTKLENGTYYTHYEIGCTSPVSSPVSSPTVIPSSVTSGAVLFAENELFDNVVYENEVSKERNKKQAAPSLKVSNGGTITGRDQYDYDRRGSRTALEPTGVSKCCSKRWCCNVTVVMSLLTIIALFTLPIIFYYVDTPENDDYSQDDADDLLRLLETCLASVSFKEIMPMQVISNERTCLHVSQCWGSCIVAVGQGMQHWCRIYSCIL